MPPEETRERIIHFTNKPFSACIEGNGDKVFSITPVVMETHASCGLAILVNNQIIHHHGPYLPRDVITAWRATKILQIVNWQERTFFRRRIKWYIGKRTLSQVYHAAMRKASDDDREKGREMVIRMIGKKKYKDIFTLPIPEIIITSIFEGQTRDPKMCICPLRAEILAGTVKRQERFELLGIH
jgi:hypothetical protein